MSSTQQHREIKAPYLLFKVCVWASILTFCLARPHPSITGRSLYLGTVRRSASRSPPTAFFQTTISPARPLQPDKRSPQTYGDESDSIYTTLSSEKGSREPVIHYHKSSLLPFKPSIHIEPDPITSSDSKTSQSHFTIPRTHSMSNPRTLYRPASYSSSQATSHSNAQKGVGISNSVQKKRRPAHKRRHARPKQRTVRVKKSRPAGRFIHHESPGHVQDAYGPFHASPGPLLYTKPAPLPHVFAGPHHAIPGPLHHPLPKPLRYTTPEPIHYTTPAPTPYSAPEPIHYPPPEPVHYTTPEPFHYTTPEPIHYSTPEPIHYNPPTPLHYTPPGPHQAGPGPLPPRPVHFAPPPGYVEYDYQDEVRHIL
ncbi:hypothetical protein Pmani_004191 [Petrolisthes manimaculis]|uniref:Uncharacterized protein n=1 Tax=Petrolisthes manimaculis TaxID=1843537 RepID=A0AAE1UIS1_9EUCA|nr:hypothetical protein Pmani_004191 [Petrolisthes manimaculis]